MSLQQLLLIISTVSVFFLSDARIHPGLKGNVEEVKALVQNARAVDSVGNAAPLIGILSQPCHDCPGTSYVAAAYVKFVEMAGGRAVPIMYNSTDEELRRLFNSINALIFPGGLTWLWLDAPYVVTARKLFNWAVEANDRGDVFPIHGTCLGHQLLHILASNISRNDLLIETDSVSHRSNLEWSNTIDNSRLLSIFPADLKTKLASPDLKITIENHEYGIPPAHYERWPVLKQWFNILSTTKDRNGVEYVSTVEAKNYPFTGTQWHPEKPPFEFAMEVIPHSLDSILVSQNFANYFVETARQSTHKPRSKDQELAMQIYSTPPVFSARFETFDEDNYDGPDMTYYFGTKVNQEVTKSVAAATSTKRGKDKATLLVENTGLVGVQNAAS